MNNDELAARDIEIERLRAEVAKLQEPVEDMAAWRLRFCGAVAEVEAAERGRLCAAIKAADDKASESDYMLDSDDCISVIRGTWNPGA